MKILRCPSCSAPVQHGKEKCEYCGSVYYFNNKKTIIKHNEDSDLVIDDDAFDFDEDSDLAGNEDVDLESHKPLTIKELITIILLLMFLGPIGFIFAVMILQKRTSNLKK